MTDIPRRAVSRTAKLAALPLGFAGRTVLGVGKRVTGLASEVISAEIQQRTAEQLFSVLGQLKGGAMKFGQALSVFEAALPEEIAAPYRQALTKLQESAPPLPVASVHKVLAEQLGPDWRSYFLEFNDKPAAAASIGQVHRAIWNGPPVVPAGTRRRGGKAAAKTAATGRPVAVKVQYPGAGDALLSDLKQLSRLGTMFRAIQPGLDIKPLLAELRDRISEELDYELEAESQRAFAAAYAGDSEIFVPEVVAASPGCWSPTGSRASRCPRSSPPAPRNSATRPVDTWPPCTSPLPAGPDCCTPIRTRATSGCCRTGGSE